MSFTQRLPYVLIVALSLSAPALAQSTRERVYGNVVAKELGYSWHEVETVTQPTQGVNVKFDGLRVKRLRFATAEAALDYAATSQDLTAVEPHLLPVVVEVRGKQVVLVSGSLARENAIARRALQAGWQYLRGSDGGTDLLAIAYGDSHVAAISPVANGPLYKAIGDAVSSARQKPDLVTSKAGAHLFAGGGTVSAFRRTARDGSFAIAPTAEQLPQIVARLQAITGQDMKLDAVIQAAAAEPIHSDITRRMGESDGGNDRSNGDWSDDFEEWGKDEWVDDVKGIRSNGTGLDRSEGLPLETRPAGTTTLPASSGGSATTVTYSSGEPTAMPMQLPGTDTAPLDLSGTWSVQVEDARGAVPGTVRFVKNRTQLNKGESQAVYDTIYDVTVVVTEGSETRTVELEGSFDGEILTTRLKPEELSGRQYQPRMGATDVLNNLGRTPKAREQADPSVQDPAEETPEGRYTVEIKAKDVTFTAETEVDPQGSTPVETFKRFNDPDVRCPSEWAPMEEVLWASPSISNSTRVVYATAIPATTSVTHRIFVKGNNDRDTLDFYLAERVDDMSHVVYVVFGPWGTRGGRWMRDFGPIVVERNSDKQPISGDMGYYRGRPKDDLVPKGYAFLRGWGHRDVNALKLEGGKLMSDGAGRVFVTNRASEGSGTQANDGQEFVEDYLFQLGGKEVLWFERMPGPKEGTGHIDMFAKLIDRNRVLIAEGGFAPAVLDRNAAKFADLGYEVTRIGMGDNTSYYTGSVSLQSYTNSLFLNGVALVPQYGDARPDAEALRIYKGLGFTAVGVDARALITDNGAIHCISMQIPKVGG